MSMAELGTSLLKSIKSSKSGDPRHDQTPCQQLTYSACLDWWPQVKSMAELCTSLLKSIKSSKNIDPRHDQTLCQLRVSQTD